MQATLPEMPVREVRVDGDSGPSDIRCSSGGADGKGCGLFLCFVGETVFADERDLSRKVAGVERWECWTCWRTVVVRWKRPEVTL